MRIVILLGLVLIAAPAFAAPDPECLERKKTDPKLTCMDLTPVPTKVPTPVELVMPRNNEAKKDVEKTAEHLEDATKRAR